MSKLRSLTKLVNFGFRPISIRNASSSSKIISSEVMDLQLPGLSFHDMCWRDGKWGDYMALIDGVRGDSYTHAEARSISKSFAQGLLELGAQPGDVLAVVMPNMPEYAFAMLGASEAALRVTTLNPTYTPHEIRGQFVNSETKFIITTSQLLQKVIDASEGLSTIKKIILIGDEKSNCIAYKDVVRNNGELMNDAPKPDLDSVYALPYSSGTTGVPKGVMLSHNNLVSQMAQMNHPKFAVIEEEEVNICVLPMYHIFAMNVTMSSMLYQGGMTITVPMFEPKMFLDMMLKYRPTNLQLAPPLVGFLATHPAVTTDHMASLKNIVVGAAPAGQALINLFLEKAPHVRFREGYGMTELSPAVTFTSKTTNETGGSCGQLLPNTQMKVIDLDSGELLGAGERGELCFSGPQVMKGYFNNDKATQETLFDGWIHTGDIGYFDENNAVYIVDRKKELIKVKGLQVAPAELENLIRGMKGVADVAVIGIPDERSGEIPRAYVVKSQDEITDKDIIDQVAAALSKHKHLTGGVEFLNVIPKSAAGKILRKDLKAAFAAKSV